MTKQKATPTHSVTVRRVTYYIRRRGSRYNILGPDGRAFKAVQCAVRVGPRWEELTLACWLYPRLFWPGISPGRRSD
jgi:hypothetical protein